MKEALKKGVVGFTFWRGNLSPPSGTAGGVREGNLAEDHSLPKMAFHGTLPTLIRKLTGGYQYRVFLGSPI
jgi:hypothetical protein